MARNKLGKLVKTQTTSLWLTGSKLVHVLGNGIPLEDIPCRRPDKVEGEGSGGGVTVTWSETTTADCFEPEAPTVPEAPKAEEKTPLGQCARCHRTGPFGFIVWTLSNGDSFCKHCHDAEKSLDTSPGLTKREAYRLGREDMMQELVEASDVAENRGRKAERAAVVAWAENAFEHKGRGPRSTFYFEVATLISRGAHLKAPADRSDWLTCAGCNSFKGPGSFIVSSVTAGRPLCRPCYDEEKLAKVEAAAPLSCAASEAKGRADAEAAIVAWADRQLKVAVKQSFGGPHTFYADVISAVRKGEHWEGSDDALQD